MTWDEFVNSQENKDYPCPCCFAEFDTQKEKSDHMMNTHMYEQLPLFPIEES